MSQDTILGSMVNTRFLKSRMAGDKLEITRTPLIKKSINDYDGYNLQNRRYIGNKFKLLEWIFGIIEDECHGETFADIFAGTGSVSAYASKKFDKIVINDFLHSNYIVYNGFFGGGQYDLDRLLTIVTEYNKIDSHTLQDNYFSLNFGGKYFSFNTAKKIGFIRENIEEMKDELSFKEYSILLSSLIYSADKISNTVGHYDAFFKKENIIDKFEFKLIKPHSNTNAVIYQSDANELVKEISSDITYIDPPYNSRQYSRFYHVLETLVKWDTPKLFGVARKPEPENISEYCKVSAKHRFADLIKNINSKYIVVSYNNTYHSKSNSSKNKISLEEIESILNNRGSTKVYKKNYRHFTTGNTDFNNHQEYLFVTTC